MRGITVFVTLLLTAAWIFLSERISVFVVVSGILVSAGCLFYSHKYLPFKEISNVSFLKLLTYPFYLVGQVYLSGFYVIKIILTGVRVDVVCVKTHLTNDFLRVILGNSITLTPGSVLLDLKEDNMTLLWLRGKDDPPYDPGMDEDIKSGLEKRLLKAQKQEKREK